MKSLLQKPLLATLVLLALTATRADAAIIVTLPTPSTAGSIVITQDISFTITTAVSPVAAIIFDEWVTSDTAREGFLTANFSPNALSYSLNGGPTATTPLHNFSDNASPAASFDSVTPNDGIIAWSNSIFVNVNNVLTVKAATYTLAAGSLPGGFNPQANQTFTGNAFLVSGSFLRLSANTSVGAVPEPSRVLLLLGGLGALTFRRRRVE